MQFIKKIFRFIIRLCRFTLRQYRKAYFKLTLANLGEGCEFGSGIIVQGHQYITIGKNCRINDKVILQSGPGSFLKICQNVTLSFGAQIMTGQYQMKVSGHNRNLHTYSSVLINENVWVGLSNYCTNRCAYCGFSADNRIARRCLTLDEAETEAERKKRVKE